MRRLALLWALLLAAVVVAAHGFPAGEAPRPAAADDKQPGTEPGGDEAPDPEIDRTKLSLVIDASGHAAAILRLFFTPDGSELISVARDGTVRFWDPETGERLRVLYPPAWGFTAAALSADGRTLAVAGIADEQRVILLLTLETGAVRVLKGHTDAVHELAFSKDGEWLASIGTRQHIRLWKVATGALEKEFAHPASLGDDVCFAPDGKHLVSAGHKDSAWLWSVPQGKPEGNLEGETEVLGAAWSPDGKNIALACKHGVRLWNVETKTGKAVGEHRGEKVLWAAPGKLLFATAYNRALLLDLDGGSERLFGNNLLVSSPKAMALAPGGELLASAHRSHDIHAWKSADGKHVHRLPGVTRLYAAGWSADGKSIAWGTEEKDPAATFHGGAPVTGAFSLEGLGLLPKKQLDAVLPEAGEYRARLAVPGASLEPAGRAALVAREGQAPVRLPLTTPVYCASFVGPDRAVVGGFLQFALFDTRTGERLCPLKGHAGSVRALAVSPDGHYLLSAGEDGTLRLWEMPRLAAAAKGDTILPVLSFFRAGSDWIAWTPEGYYAASPNGERLLGWRLNNGPEKLATFYRAEQFHDSFARPDLIKSIFQKKLTLEKALLLIDKAKKALTVGEVLPPQVMITSPERNGIILQQPELTIEATAESQGKDPVATMQLFLDGVPYDRDQGPTPVGDPKKPTVRWAVQVPPGRHRFIVVAQTRRSQGESEVWVNNVAAAPLPRLFVLAVGNNAYQSLKPLDCARKDAHGLEQAFLDYSKGKPKLFRDVASKVVEDATRKDILAGLDWLKAQNVTAEDVIVLFLSGHGERDGQGEFWFLGVDAGAKNRPLADTALSGTELKRRIKELPCRRMLVLLDACHSGAIGGIEDLAVQLKQSDYGVVVICSAMGEELSWENEQLGHGYFTQALMEGLGGKAGTNPAGEITVSRLSVYVEEQVPEATEQKQHPVVGRPTTVRPFALARP
jgi:WD40 repeat protein